MKIEPIEIVGIVDPKLFTDISILLDNDNFKDRIGSLRQEFSEQLNLVLPIPIAQYLEFLKSVKTEFWSRVLDRVTYIRGNFLLTKNYEDVILKSVFCGEVDSEDYFLAKLKVKIDSLDPNGDIPDDQYSIAIFPGVRDVDLSEINKQFQKELHKRANPSKPTDENVADYSWSPQLNFRDEPSKPTIIQSRNWYLTVKVNRTKSLVELVDDLTINWISQLSVL